MDDTPQLERGNEQHPDPAGETRRSTKPGRRTSLVLMTIAAAAVAAIILAVPPPDRPVRVELLVDGASDERDLFRADPDAGAPADRDAPFYIGVRLDKPEKIRIAARLASGVIQALPLNSAGDLQIPVPADRDCPFGPYPIRGPMDGDERDVTHFVIVAGGRTLSDADFRSALKVIAERSAAATAAELPDRLMREFFRQLRARTRVLVISEP